MRTKLLSTLGLLLAFSSSALAAPAKPNILFLLSDDHSAPYVGCYGCKDVRTPNLDRFAAQGMRFDRMFVTCPQCVPSRATLMTGRSPVAVRMVRFTSPLPAELPALPDLLRDKAGYFTGVGGRHYHLDGPSGTGRHACPEIDAVLKKYNLRTFTNRVDYVEQPGPLKDFGKKLEAFLDAAPKGKPWFFWLGFSDPHHAWQAQGPNGPPDAAKLTLPPHLPDLPGVRGDLARYLAEV
ncbi:MAG: arylsulfatase, partial [Verrucomicrobia bacterium]|nr:arylsulfatase [Verrucomicrobiota bacterium]